MTFNPQQMFRDYQAGLRFKRGDVLVPKPDAKPYTFGVIEETVVVESQDTLAPHQYTVIGERANPASPSRRFVKFEINGHDWELKP